MKKYCNAIFLCILMPSLFTMGCNESVRKRGFEEEQSISRNISKPSNVVPEDQLAIAKKTHFDRSIRTYDTTAHHVLDSIPFRLMSFKEIYSRMPWKKEIGGKLMTGNGVGYDYNDDNWRIHTTYPGVIGYFGRGMGNFAKKVEFIDTLGNILHVLDFDKLTPYSTEKYNNIRPGRYNFEIMHVDENLFDIDFKKNAVTFLEDREVFLLYSTDWIVANYRIFGLDDNGFIIGHESILEVYNNHGEIEFSRKIPFSIASPFISTDNKRLVFETARMKYMSLDNDFSCLVCCFQLDDDRLSGIGKIENDRWQTIGLGEYMKEDLLYITYKDIDVDEQFFGVIDVSLDTPKYYYYSHNEVEFKKMTDLTNLLSTIPAKTKLFSYEEYD